MTHKKSQNHQRAKRYKLCAFYAHRVSTHRGARCLRLGGGNVSVCKQTLTDSNIPTFNSFPKTVLSPSAEQFQRPFLNWNWHSLMPIWAPSPMTIMASGRLWQIIRCLGAKPGILLQIMLAPRATTDEKPLWMEDEKWLSKIRYQPLIPFPFEYIWLLV